MRSHRVSVPTRGTNCFKPYKRTICSAAGSLSSNQNLFDSRPGNDECNREKQIPSAVGLGSVNAILPAILPGSTDNNRSSPRRSPAIASSVQRLRHLKNRSIGRLEIPSLDFIAALERHRSQRLSTEPNRKITKIATNIGHQQMQSLRTAKTIQNFAKHRCEYDPYSD